MKPAQGLILIPICFFTAGVSPLMAQTAPKSPEPAHARINARAEIENLSRRLQESNSATTTIEKWCADHCMAFPAKIVARRVAGAEKTPDPETRRRLGAGNGDTIRYRRVQLMCGKHILSEADNWYLPARLPAETNVMLETGDTPFGKAIRSLHPKRQTIMAKVLWSPTPAQQSGPPPYVLEHRALILGQNLTPLSEVAERYTRELLDFGKCETPDRPGR